MPEVPGPILGDDEQISLSFSKNNFDNSKKKTKYLPALLGLTMYESDALKLIS